MKKETAQDIACVLVAKVGKGIDFFALKDVELPVDDKIKILKEVESLCKKMVDKVERKYNIHIGYTTIEIIESIKNKRK